MYRLLLVIFFYVSSTFASEGSWSVKMLESMSLDEKIGQLFMVAGYVEGEELDEIIKDYHVGGIAYVGPSTILKQVTLTNHYQTISKYPILIAQDLEWGLAMRLKDGMCFPKNSTLGVLADSNLIYQMGREIGRQAGLIGVHMNLSPVLDVNTEPENLAINVRSFGSDPERVAYHGSAMIRGLQDGGVIASAKHFPGLGAITIDPHLGLPCSKRSKKQLMEIDLYPFAIAIRDGMLSIQTEHLVVPALEVDGPASLSKAVVTDLLQKEMGFKGLVLSGALNMKALTNHFSDEDIVLKAFQAGSDMLLMPRDIKKAHQTLKNALVKGAITLKDVEGRVLKILQMKERLQLHRERIRKLPTLESLQTLDARVLKKQLYAGAVRVIRDTNRLLPIKQDRLAYVQLGDPASADCLERLRDKHHVDSFVFPQAELDDEEALLKQLEKYACVVLAVYPADPRRITEIRQMNGQNQIDALKHFRVHGLSESWLRLIAKLKAYESKTIVAFFGSPYGLPFFEGYSSFLMGYEEDPEAQKAVIALILASKSKNARECAYIALAMGREKKSRPLD